MILRRNILQSPQFLLLQTSKWCRLSVKFETIASIFIDVTSEWELARSVEFCLLAITNIFFDIFRQLATHTQLGPTRMFEVLVSSESIEKTNHCPRQRDVPCLQQINQAYHAMHNSMYPIYIYFPLLDWTVLFLTFLTFSTATWSSRSHIHPPDESKV